MLFLTGSVVLIRFAAMRLIGIQADLIFSAKIRFNFNRSVCESLISTTEPETGTQAFIAA